ATLLTGAATQKVLCEQSGLLIEPADTAEDGKGINIRLCCRVETVMAPQSAFLESEFISQIAIENARRKQGLDPSLIRMVTNEALHLTAPGSQFSFRSNHTASYGLKTLS